MVWGLDFKEIGWFGFDVERRRVQAQYRITRSSSRIHSDGLELVENTVLLVGTGKSKEVGN